MTRKPDWAKNATEFYGETDLAVDVAGARIADLGASIARQASRHIEEQSRQARQYQPPWWAREQCPDWCLGFHERTSPRRHTGAAGAVHSPLHPPLPTPGKHAAQVVTSVRLDTGQREPYVILSVMEGHDRAHLKLTLDGVRRLVDDLCTHWETATGTAVEPIDRK